MDEFVGGNTAGTPALLNSVFVTYVIKLWLKNRNKRESEFFLKRAISFTQTKTNIETRLQKRFDFGNVQIFYDALGGGLLRPSEYRHMVGREFRQIVLITFIVTKKANLQFILLYLRYMWEEGVSW